MTTQGSLTNRRRRRAHVAAFFSVAFVVLFAFAFIGVVFMLNEYADSLHEDTSIEIGEEAPSEPFYVLLIGSDSRMGTAIYAGKPNDSTQNSQYADIMTLMRIDPQTYTITLVTIPRDTMIDGQTDKVNASLLSGDPKHVVEAVGDLTSVYADYYMMTTFISFENLINALGGIDITVPETVVVEDPATGKNVTVKKGKNRHLNGAEVLVLARARKEYNEDQDALRQVNVRNIERTMIQKALNMNGEYDVEHMITAIGNDTKTDLDLSAMGLLMLQFIEHSDEVKIYDCTGPYKGTVRASDGLWFVRDDEQAWEELMAVVDSGRNPSKVIKAPQF